MVDKVPVRLFYLLDYTFTIVVMSTIHQDLAYIVLAELDELAMTLVK